MLSTMSIPRKFKPIPPPEGMEMKVVAVADGVIHSKPKDGRKWYVLARSREWFLEYVRVVHAGNLLACNYISTVEQMRGLGFTSPLRELVCVDGWQTGRVDDEEFVSEAHRLIARYCLEKRVHTVPTWNGEV